MCGNMASWNTVNIAERQLSTDHVRKKIPDNGSWMESATDDGLGYYWRSASGFTSRDFVNQLICQIVGKLADLGPEFQNKVLPTNAELMNVGYRV